MSGHGLKPTFVDASLSGLIAGASFAGFAAGKALVSTPSRSLVPLLAAGAVVAAVWGVVALWYLWRRRRESARDLVGPGDLLRSVAPKGQSASLLREKRRGAWTIS